MNKKLIISAIVLFFVVAIGLGIWETKIKNRISKEEQSNEINNNIEISKEIVTDDCVNEWSDYAKVVQNEIIETGSNLNNDDVRYLAKDVDGYINIYYLDEDNNESLYKKTEISTEYLSVEDLDDLEIGVEVVGSEELNKLLENFE